jgi:hypothetical protein
MSAPPNSTAAGGSSRPTFAIAIISLPVHAGDKRRQSALFFNGLLGAFILEERGSILERHGKERSYKYRFRDPKMQPFVLMQGIATHELGNDALKVLSAPEQPRLSNEF